MPGLAQRRIRKPAMTISLARFVVPKLPSSRLATVVSPR
jgi:hypothetical protein